MNIGINTRFLLSKKMEGFGWFTYEVVKRMVINHPEHKFFFFFDRKFDNKFIFSDNVIPIILSPQARHPILFKIWFNISVSKAIKKHQIDVFFSPDGYLSLKTNCKQIPVIHDLNFEHHPNDLPKNVLKYYKKYFPKFCQKAHKIITVSEFSKNDIIQKYGIDADKIHVAYNGANEKYKRLNQSEKNTIKAKWSNGEEYFVFVGSLHPRKNIGRMFKAFDAFKSKSDSKTKLIVVGEELWSNKFLKSDFESLKYHKDIIFTGHQPIDNLIEIVGAAKSLVLVSYFEGFGIPLVEAMQSGVPVLTSNITALPEIIEDAGLKVNPFSIEEISKGFEDLDTHKELREKLINYGFERVKFFSWDNTEKLIWEVIESTFKTN